MSARLHAHTPEAPAEMPLQPVEALAFALAAARRRPALTSSDMADAALLLVDLRQAGLDVAPGAALGSRSGRIAILAQFLAGLVGRSTVQPRDRAEAERVTEELRTIGFDLAEAGSA